MELLFAGLGGAVVALVAAYFLYVKGVIDDLDTAEEDASEARSVARSILGEIDSAWYCAFGPVGISQQQKNEAFNALWKRAGKTGDDLRGIPQG